MPLKGRFEGALTARTVTPPFLSISFEGTGNATHLGRFTVEIQIALNTTNRTLTGTYEFTAANGDTLTADVTGQSPPNGPWRSADQCGNGDHYRGDGAVRQRQWELHCRARGRPCDRLDHRLVRGDDLLARRRQTLRIKQITCLPLAACSDWRTDPESDRPASTATRPCRRSPARCRAALGAGRRSPCGRQACSVATERAR